MKTDIKIVSILIALCFCSASVALAQEQRQSISAHWGGSIPIDNGFIAKTGFVNPSLEWGFRLLPALSAGISLGYGYATEKGIGNEHVDGDLASGYREKSLSVIPLLVKMNYFPLGDRITLFAPYIGAGAGVGHATFDIKGEAINAGRMGNWAELFSAQVGTRIQPVGNGKLYFDACFLWQYGGNNWSLVEVKSIHTLGFCLGVGVKF